MEFIDVGNATINTFKQTCVEHNGQCIADPVCPFLSFCEFNGFGPYDMPPNKLYIPPRNMEDVRKEIENIIKEYNYEVLTGV